MERLHHRPRGARLPRHQSHLRVARGLPLRNAPHRAVDGLEPGPGAASCGTAAFRRERVVSFDVKVDPNIAQVLTQIRKSQADSKLPAEVRELLQHPDQL